MDFCGDKIKCWNMDLGRMISVEWESARLWTLRGYEHWFLMSQSVSVVRCLISFWCFGCIMISGLFGVLLSCLLVWFRELKIDFGKVRLWEESVEAVVEISGGAAIQTSGGALVVWTRKMYWISWLDKDYVCMLYFFCQFMLMRKFVYCVCDCACDLEICVHTVRDILRYFILCFIREYV